MEEQKAVQLEYRAAEGSEGAEGALVIAERQDLPERGPDGRQPADAGDLQRPDEGRVPGVFCAGNAEGKGRSGL